MTNPHDWALGVSTIFFQQFTRAEMDACVASNILNVEVCLFGGWFQAIAPADSESITAACHKLRGDIVAAGLRVWSVHLPFGQHLDISNPDPALRAVALEKNMENLRRAVLFSPEKVIVHPSAEPIAPETREDCLQACDDSLKQLSKAARALGTQLCVECLPRTCLANAIEEMQYLLAGNPLLEVCCDTNHLLTCTTEDFIQAIGSRVTTVHASDYDRIDERHWIPGRGVNDWSAILAQLATNNFAGPFTFEVKPDEGTTMEPAALRAWWDTMIL